MGNCWYEVCSANLLVTGMKASFEVKICSPSLLISVEEDVDDGDRIIDSESIDKDPSEPLVG